MKNEFANDPIMRELHEIREKHYQETKNLSLKEARRYISQSATRLLSAHGYKLVPTSRGTRKLVRI